MDITYQSSETNAMTSSIVPTNEANTATDTLLAVETTVNDVIELIPTQPHSGNGDPNKGDNELGTMTVMVRGHRGHSASQSTSHGRGQGRGQGTGQGTPP